MTDEKPKHTPLDAIQESLGGCRACRSGAVLAMRQPLGVHQLRHRALLEEKHGAAGTSKIVGSGTESANV
jgi:hypothetical protein